MRTALSPLLLLVAGALLPSCGDGQARPNVLLVTLDTTRPDRMSVYGGKAQVPTLERIAGDQTSFESGPLEGVARDGQLAAFRHTGFWQPMDTLRDKNALEALWTSGEAPWKVWS